MTLEVFQAWELGHLGLAAGTDCGDNTLEVAIGGVIYDPASLFVLVDLLNGGIEPGPGFQAVFLPDLFDLTEDLLPVGVAALPLDGRVEAEHHGVDLKA